MYGIRSSPAARSDSSRTRGRLSGEPKCGPPRSQRRSAALSSMRPIETECGRSLRNSSADSTPELMCGKQSCLLDDGARGVQHVVGRRRMAEPGERLARDAVAQLRLVAEREQRLLAAGRGTGTRDVEHVIELEIRFRQLSRTMSERAVVTHVAAQLRQRDEHLA